MNGIISKDHISKHTLHSFRTESKKIYPAIGVFMPNILPGNNESFWLGAVDAAHAYDVHVLSIVGGQVRSPNEHVAQANILYELASDKNLDGLVIWSGTVGWNILGEELDTYFRRYRPLPCVSVEERVPGVPCILKDNYHGMREAIVHLIEVHGLRRIAFLRGPEGVSWAEERYRAFQETLKAYDLPGNPELTIEPPCSWFDPALGERTIGRLLDERQLDVDAIVSVADSQTRLVVKALQARGLRVPGDIAVIGFDDEQESAVVTPPLTTVRNPIYEMSRKAIEVLIAQLHGEKISQQIVLPTTLVIRQSCGCQLPIVVQATSDQKGEAEPSVKVAMTEHRQQILSNMESELEALTHERHAGGWFEQLFDVFFEDISKSSSGQFLATLEDMVWHIEWTEKDIALWHHTLSVLRKYLLPYLTPHGTDRSYRDRAEDLWQQARALLGEVTRHMEIARHVQTELQNHLLREIGARLISTFEVNALMGILAENLPQIGIPGCCLALYEHPVPYAYPHPAPAWSRLKLAYTEKGRVELDSSGLRFPTQELLPAELLSQERCSSLLIESLYFRNQQFGFIVFEVGGRKGHIYERLRVEISSALQEALLVQHIQEHAAELAQKNYILDTFMETVPDSIYFKDSRGYITRSNTAHARQLGCLHPDEEIGKSDFDFFPEEQARIKFQQEQKILRSGQAILALEELDALGRWILTTKMPLRNEHDEIIGTFGISRDISELKKNEQELLRHRQNLEELVAERTAEITRVNSCLRDEIFERERVEEALRAGEQQYRLLAENVKDGIIIIQNDIIVFTNEVFAAMLGYSVDELLRSDPQTLFPGHVKNAVEPLPFLRQSQSDGSSHPASSDVPKQIELLHKQQQTLWTEIEQSAIIWKTQSATLLTIRNINQSKLRELRLEEERVRLRQENLLFKSTIGDRFRFGELIGKSPAMQRVYELIISAATSGVNVLVYGESGTGMQAKLLRVLQDGEYMPLGSNVAKQADVLILAATNKQCRDEIAAGRLRQDFFYRIGVIEITVPPLRERREDLPLLIEHVLAQYGQKQESMHGAIPKDLPTNQGMLPADLVQALYSYAWPGNIRELQNILQRYLATNDLPSVLGLIMAPEQMQAMTSLPLQSPNSTLPEIMQALETRILTDVLQRHNYHTGKAAEQLGITRRALQKKIVRFQLKQKAQA